METIQDVQRRRRKLEPADQGCSARWHTARPARDRSTVTARPVTLQCLMCNPSSSASPKTPPSGSIMNGRRPEGACSVGLPHGMVKPESCFVDRPLRCCRDGRAGTIGREPMCMTLQGGMGQEDVLTIVRRRSMRLSRFLSAQDW
jgi:hypothetical protein